MNMNNATVCNVNALVLATMAIIAAGVIDAIAGNEISTTLNGATLNSELSAELIVQQLGFVTT